MRILFTIAHFHTASRLPASDGRPHGSLGKLPEPRLQALATCISALHQLFGQRQVMIEPARKIARPANQLTTAKVDIVVCTTQERHLLAELALPASTYSHHATTAVPMLLGFECQAVLRDRLGDYDYYCYLEDDM